MSARDVQLHILEPMQRVYAPRRNMDNASLSDALRDYVAALERFEAPDLQAAWSSVRDSHQQGYWPAPALFVTAARKCRNDRIPDRSSSNPFKRPTPTELWDRWLAMRKFPIAKKAVEMDVAWSLKCAILDGTEPATISLADLRMKKNSAERTAQKIENGEPHDWLGRRFTLSEDNAEAALKMWRSIQAQEIQTQQEIREAA